MTISTEKVEVFERIHVFAGLWMPTLLGATKLSVSRRHHHWSVQSQSLSHVLKYFIPSIQILTFSHQLTTFMELNLVYEGDVHLRYNTLYARFFLLAVALLSQTKIRCSSVSNSMFSDRLIFPMLCCFWVRMAFTSWNFQVMCNIWYDV